MTQNNLFEIAKKDDQSGVKFLNFNKDEVKRFNYDYELGVGETIIVETNDGRRGMKEIKETPPGITIETNTVYEPSLPYDEYLLNEQILYLYTVDKRTQTEISKMIGVPQPTISRILQSQGFSRGNYIE